MKTKKFTILHSNDMHGDFLAEIQGQGGKLIGGLSLLSGYINKVRQEEENVLYVISGDMVQGSLIDTEYKGISTMEIMNYLAPDVVALGNHEFDYGLPHLLFLEKMANFPIVNANLYIKQYNKRLMKSHLILNKAGFDILFTGIITEKVMDALKQDELISSFVTLEEASREIEKICNTYKNEDIDLTIILTHIGFESDIQLAKIISPQSGVDIIIGGHSHTILQKPAVENNIIIVQAGVGTDQIGRLDVVVDDDTNSVVEYTWKLIPIDSNLANPDPKLEKFISQFQEAVDHKYNAVIGKLAIPLTHPIREVETSLGNLVADAFAERAESDLALVGSGSIRIKEIGPVITLRDLHTCMPFDDTLTRYSITGLHLRDLFSHIMRAQNRNGEGECFQVNDKVKANYDDKQQKLISLKICETEVLSSKVYKVCLQGYHVKNSVANLNLSQENLVEEGSPNLIATSAQDVLVEYIRTHLNTKRQVEGRMTYLQ
jgi:5'-nucleotidase/UDP-sugar diphosphatase